MVPQSGSLTSSVYAVQGRVSAQGLRPAGDDDSVETVLSSDMIYVSYVLVVHFNT
jgi:hypothetical protein